MLDRRFQLEEWITGCKTLKPACRAYECCATAERIPELRKCEIEQLRNPLTDYPGCCGAETGAAARLNTASRNATASSGRNSRGLMVVVFHDDAARGTLRGPSST